MNEKLNDQEIKALEEICEKWAVNFPAKTVSCMLQAACNVKVKMLKFAQTATLLELQDEMANAEFISNVINRLNAMQVEEERMLKATRNKFLEFLK